MFRPDQPISSASEDLLGRAPFAKALAGAILAHKTEETIVIGLHGEWGSGKTSVINLAIEQFDILTSNTDDVPKPAVLRFNPWNFSDQNQLIEQFFSQLSATLNRPNFAKKLRDAGERLKTYARYFSPVAVLVPKAGPLAKGASWLGTALMRFAEKQEGDLAAVRAELNGLLAGQPHKVVIVIDDIDRLTSQEIRQVFQLVKSLCDFPNTVYVLSFDRSVVVKALNEVHEGKGAEYLEKIVQVPFDVPRISRAAVERLLFSQLDSLVHDAPSDTWDQRRWGNLYGSGIRLLVGDIRDVSRWVNSLRLSFPIVKGNVNVPDFLAITALQVFEPGVYEGIRDNKDVFAGLLDDHDRHGGRDQLRLRCDEVIARATVLTGETLRDFLERLFPKLEGLYGNGGYTSGFLREWRRAGQVCSPDVFDTYFMLSVPDDSVSLNELRTLLSAAGDREAFAAALAAHVDAGRVDAVLTRLEDYTEESIPIEHASNVIGALFDLGDSFPERPRAFHGMDTQMRILRVTHQLVTRIQEPDQRYVVLARAIREAEQSLYPAVHEVSVLDQEQGRFGGGEARRSRAQKTVSPEHLDALEQLACEKIQEWARGGRLARHPHLGAILFRWKEWGPEGEAQQFVADLTAQPEGLAQVLRGFVQERQSKSLGDLVATPGQYVSLDGVAEFMPVEDLAQRARAVKESVTYSALSEREQSAVDTFLDTVDGRLEDPLRGFRRARNRRADE